MLIQPLKRIPWVNSRDAASEDFEQHIPNDKNTNLEVAKGRSDEMALPLVTPD
jgi:hypothetical protein